MVKSLKTFVMHPMSWAIGLIFSVDSILFGGWLARIPEIQHRLGLSEGMLGLALLGMPIGSLVMMPLASRIIAKYGLGRTTFVSALVVVFALTLPAFSFSFYSLMAAMFIVGFTGSIMNVAMNASASSVEKKLDISIMSTCHGVFSFGGMIGAALATLFIGMGVSPELHLSIIAVFLLGVVIILKPILFKIPDISTKVKKQKSSFKLPEKSMLGLIVVGFCIMLGEGAVADWSAVYLRNYLHSAPAIAGLGFAGFSLAMALGRLSGDNITSRFGGKRVVIVGSILGAVGLLLGVVVPVPSVAIAGFILVGFGFSCVVPILYNQAGKGDDAENGIAMIATSGIIGFLAGPPLIGAMAEMVGLSWALVLVAGLALFSGIVATRL